MNKKFKTLLILSSTFIIVFGLVFCLLVYNGVILLNNPSEKEYPIRGVDVSSYQGDIDWKILSKQNIDFAFIKATEGSTHIDKCFKNNFSNALKTNLSVGAYHFFSFDSEGKTQAENFISNVPKTNGMLPPVVDVEFYSDKKENPPSKEYVTEELYSILAILEKHYCVKPIIYTTEEVYYLYIKENFNDYDLWIRNVICKPDKSIADWKFWQYTNREVLNGYSGDEKYIDVNVFNGSAKEFFNYQRVGN